MYRFFKNLLNAMLKWKEMIRVQFMRHKTYRHIQLELKEHMTFCNTAAMKQFLDIPK